MKNLGPMLLLALGLGLAASFGGRNGGPLTARRTLVGQVNQAQDLIGRPAAHQAAVNKAKQAGKPAPEPLSAELLASVERAKQQLPGLKRELDASELPSPSQRVASWAMVSGTGWLLGLILMFVGALWARMNVKAAATSGAGGAVDFLGGVAQIRQRAGALVEPLSKLPMAQDAPHLRDSLDTIALEVIAPIVDRRAQLMAKHGISGFATYFGPFSGAERNLNRCWSAITDQHAHEAAASLQRALAFLDEAEAAYRSVDQGE